jgi:hypothetical protein
MEGIQIAAALLMVAAMVLAGVRGKRRQDLLKRVWPDAAQRLGGRFVPAVPLPGEPGTPARLEARIAGIEVVASHTEVATTIVASVPALRGLEIALSPRVVLPQRAFGADEVALDDAPFRARFFVRSNDPALARAWLGDSLREALLAAARPYAFWVVDGGVIAQREGVDHDATALVDAMTAVAALAAGRSLLDGWRQVAVDLDSSLDGEVFDPAALRFPCEVDGRQIVVETVPQPRGVRLSRELGLRDTAPFALEPGAPLTSLPDAARVLPASVTDAAWQAVQPARLASSEGKATLTLDGYLPDLSRLRVALSLLAKLEAVPPTPYR